METNDVESKVESTVAVAQCEVYTLRFTIALRCFPSFRFHACPETPPTIRRPQSITRGPLSLPHFIFPNKYPPLYANSTSGNARFVCNYPVPFRLYCYTAIVYYNRSPSLLSLAALLYCLITLLVSSLSLRIRTNKRPTRHSENRSYKRKLR